jgi:hypothetical protein
MTTIQERIESLWHSRRIQKPYENGDQIYINVYSPVLERGLQNEQYLNQGVSNNAAALILDYYGLVGDNEAVRESIVITDIYFPSRKMSNPILKMGVPKSVVESANDVVGDTQSYSLMFTDKEVADFKQTINSLFPVYQQQLKFFNGSISPNINFLDLEDKINLFFDNLAAFIQFNGYDTSDYNKIGIKFDSNLIAQSVIIQQKKTNNLVNIPLVNGVKFYFETKKEGSNKYVNEIVSNMKLIMLDAKMKINWTQFVYNYLSKADIQINFYGKPRTETEASKANEIEEEGDFGPLAATKEEAQQLQRSLNDRITQQRGFEEAQKEIQNANLTLQSRLQEVVSEIENVNNEIDSVKAILHKYNISTLLEAALECLLFKGGFNGATPDFLPGLNPFEPQYSKPSIVLPEIPFKLPIISINEDLQDQVRENLKRAAISAAMSAIQTVALLIKEYCLRRDDNDDTPSTPAQDLFPDPENDGLYDCYRDFNFIVSSPELFEVPAGVTESSVLEGYLTDLSPLITPRELCDLFNDTASNDVLQVANNLIDTSWPQIRINFPDSEAIQSFFSCIGNLLDPSYCQGVYNDLTQDLPEIDPCTIEDSQPYQDIVDLLENINDLYQDPDMACGAGIVPPLAEIAAYNDSVTRLIDSVVSTIQQVFVNDLGNFKESVLLPKPLDPADQAKLNELEALLQFLQPPQPPTMELPGGSESFFDRLIPDQLQQKASDFQNIHNALTAQARGVAEENLKEILASQELLVAPGTRTVYEEIENNFLTSLLLTNSSSQDAARFYSFATSLRYDGSINGRDVLYSFPLNTQQQDDLVTVFGTPLTTDNQLEKDKILDVSGFPAGSQFVSAREILAREFSNRIFNYFDNTIEGVDKPLLEDFAITKLYPYFHFGLINTLAYKISVSDLFNADAINSLNLFPKFCQDGSISNSDLLDVNSIKQSALQEFVDNSCIDREFELGPVRDAGILAIVELYMQVIIVDLVLKNIFMTTKFGIDYLGNADSIVNELFAQTIEDIRLGSVSSVLGPYNRLPKIVKQAAAMIVKKTINRSLEPNVAPFIYPISGELTEDDQQFINSNNFEPSGVSVDNPTMQNIATQYLFEKRLLATAAKIKEFFNVPGNTYIENYLYNGTQFVDMRQLTAGGETSYVVFDDPVDYFTKFNYIDQGRELYDLYYSKPDSDELASFSGSVSQQRIEKEVNSFLTYGAFVAEKYFEVTYSEEGLEQLNIPSELRNAIIEQFEDLTPISIPQKSSSDNGENYLLSFEKMANILYSIVPLADIRAAIKKGGLKFYLTGYNNISSSPDNLYQRRAVNVELGIPGWNDSSPYKMSDYTLLRDWWKAIKLEGLPILEIETLNPIKFDLYGPLNAEKIDSEEFPNWIRGVPTSGQLVLKKYGPVSVAGVNRNFKTISGPVQGGGDDLKGTFLFNVETFRGKKVFGYYEDDGFSIEKATAFDWKKAAANATYTIAESKNFAIVVSSNLDVSEFEDPNPGIFYIGIKRKYASGNIAGGPNEFYSTIDLYDDDGSLDDEYQEFRYKKIIEVFEQYENEESLLTQNTVVDENGVIQSSINGAVESPELSEIFENILPSIEMKTRMVYITPDDEFLGDYFDDDLNIDVGTIKSLNSFYEITNSNSSGRHIATNFNASVDVMPEFISDTFLANFAANGADSLIDNIFDDRKPALIQQLATSLQPLMGSPSPVNLTSILQYLYITGEIKTYYDLFSDNDIFTDTKALLVLALQAAFGSVEDSPCDVSALQNALLSGADRSLAPIASMGQSFLNKMLNQTPKYILKGVVEMTEPHVMVSKKVKDVSRNIFQKIKTAENIAAMASAIDGLSVTPGAADAECGPDIPSLTADQLAQQSGIDLAGLPSLEEIISQMQVEVDSAYPEGFPDALKPSITEKGIDLVGSIPYTIFNPPITPFGLVYILLRLAELGQQELEVQEDCEDQ